MRNRPFKGILLFFLLSMLITPGTLRAAAPTEGMTQGDFALWLVKEVGALAKLSPAATGQEAIDFLKSLGLSPEEGWDANKPVTKKFLASLLGDPDAENLSFDDLVAKVRDFVQNLFNDPNRAVFRAGASSASGSAPV